MTRMNSSQGFSLIELMVTMVIAGFVFVGVGGMFQTQMASSIGNQDESEMQASAQAAANMISSDIVMAGFGRTLNSPAFAHSNVGGTTPGADGLVIATASNGGSALTSFVVWGGNQFSGGVATKIPIRCFGRDGDGIETVSPWLGEKADKYRDVLYLAGETTSLLFVSPFSGLPLTTVSPNPVVVTASELTADGRCKQMTSIDQNGDGVDESVILVSLASDVSVPKGTAVYGIRGTGFTTYALATSTATLFQNGVPILVGVEDFQLRYFDATGCAAGCDSISGVDTRGITQVSIGFVVRSQRRDPLKVGDKMPAYVTHDHTLTVTADMSQYSRRQYYFTVRPKNNAL